MIPTRHFDFVTLVQTIVLHQRPPLEIGISILEAAMQVPAEALPASLRDAAFQLWQWKLGKEKKPEYIEEYEEAKRAAEEEKKRAVVIKLNREVDCSAWWMHAEACSNTMPRACVQIVCDRVDAITVARRDAEAFREWGTTIDGWYDGPPFTFHNMDGTVAFN